MATAGEIEILREAIGHALADNTLVVPMYQRSYAWEGEQVNELFQDIANAIATNEKEYFIGSIVVTPQDQFQEVVDGQQRLATATIFLAAVRDYFLSTSDAERATTIEQRYLMTTDLRTKEIRPRFRLNATDNDFFLKRIIAKPSSPDRNIPATRESHKRIQQAALLAAKRVNDIVQPYSPGDRPARLLDWVDYLEKQIRVIWVKVPDDANA